MSPEEPEHAHVLTAPNWVSTLWSPTDRDAERLLACASRVARELQADEVAPSRPGGNHWVISYDVVEAAWYPAEPGSDAHADGREWDGFSRGQCLLLFPGGELAQADWYGETDPRGSSIRIDALTLPRIPEHAWSAANVARWRLGGRAGRYPNARKHFRGFWPPPSQVSEPWTGTIRQLELFAADGGASQLPRHFAEGIESA